MNDHPESITPQPALVMRKALLGGFTLTELLLAILIVAVLLVIAFPISQRAAMLSASTKCVANLRGYGTAIASYVAEQGYYMKPGYESGNNAALWNYNLSQSGALPFAEQRKLYCPELYRSSKLFGGQPESQWVASGYVNGVGYIYNAWLAGKRPQSLGQPSQTMLLMEGGMDGRVVAGNNRDKLDYRHQGKMNVLFCDGSIQKGITGQQLPAAADGFWAYPRIL